MAKIEGKRGGWGMCAAVVWVSMVIHAQPSIAAEPGVSWNNEFLRISWKPGATVVELRNLRTQDLIRIPVAIAAVEFDTSRLSSFTPAPASPMVTEKQGRTIWRFTLADAYVPGCGTRVQGFVEFTFDASAYWVRKKAVLTTGNNPEPLLLKAVVLDEISFEGRHPRPSGKGWQSYPVLADAFFCGVEFPVARAEVAGTLARLSYQPGVRLAAGEPYTTWSAVYGVTPAGQSRAAFESYVESLRKTSAPIHIQYNSWWSAPAPFTEQHMLDLIGAFHGNFYTPHGGRLDSFCLDMGWSKPKSIWRIDEENFPQGFGNLAGKLDAMEARLGLWVSPTSHYPGGLDNAWAKANGYETFPRKGRSAPLACLAGVNYRSAFRDSLVDLIRRYRIAHFKFDGYQPECPEADHGHEPGALSAEKVALGVIDVFEAVREANPDIWLEATCFGFRPSPWWLAYVDTVIGTFGDDAPHGRVPCPIYRESYTTGRDFFNLQGTKDVVIPIRGQEVLGIIHQSEEPLQNDAVTTILRGHSFVPLYVNPKYMDARRWRFLTKLCSWARDNATLLARTTPVYLGGWADDRPEGREGAAPRDPYGYAHADGKRGLLLLRNPWVKPTQVELVLDESTGVPKSFQGGCAVLVYPEFRKLESPCTYGDRLTVSLGPYETRLLAFGGYPSAPEPSTEKRTLAATDLSSDVSADDGKVQLRFTVSGNVPAKQLWVLAEAEQACSPPECRIEIDGARIEPDVVESVMGWRATGRKVPEHWVWTIADLPAGRSQVKCDVAVLDDVKLSAWLVGKKPVPDDPAVSGPIPPPEERFLDAVEVLAPVQLRYAGAEKWINVALASQGATATASSMWSIDHEPRLAIDGMVSSRWNSAIRDRDGAWLQVDFGAARRIHEIRFLEAAGGRITKYRVRTWNGTAWEDLVTAAKDAGRTTVRHRFEPVTTTRVRLEILAATEVPTIYEFEARGDAAPATTGGESTP